MRVPVLKSLATTIALIQLTACAPDKEPRPALVIRDVNFNTYGAKYHYLIKFAPNSTTLTKEALYEIESATLMITRVQMDAFGLSGYGDATGLGRAKRTLALRRVKVVADEMIRRGVPRAKIVINDYVWSDRHPPPDAEAIGSVEVNVLLDTSAHAPANSDGINRQRPAFNNE